VRRERKSEITSALLSAPKNIISKSSIKLYSAAQKMFATSEKSATTNINPPIINVVNQSLYKNLASNSNIILLQFQDGCKNNPGKNRNFF
jgi:hypothetical protein